MADTGIISLDQPRSVSRRGVGLVAVVSALYLGVAIFVRTRTEVVWPDIPVFATAHAFGVAILAGLTGLALWSYAVATRQRGYLWLGGSYCYLAALLFLFPLFFPNGLIFSDPPSSILGGPNSGPWLFTLWHIGFLVGLIAGSAVLARDSRTGIRRPPFHPVLSAVVMVILTGAALAVAGIFSENLPPLLDGQVPTRLFVALLDVSLWLALLTAVLLIFFARRRSLISLWLVAVAVVAVGEAFMAVGGPRYSMPWYYNRISGLVTALVLLMLLVGQLGRMGRLAERFAETDMLTGLASRRSLLAQLGSVMERPGGKEAELVVAMLDLDNFKEANDTLGHPTGDLMLEQVAERIRRTVPPTAVVGRLGGDEFGVLLPGVEPDDAGTVVASIQSRIEEPFEVADATPSLSASAGMVQFPRDGETPEELLRSADLAMLAAKRSGVGRMRWFDPSMARAAESSARLRRDLRQALARGDISLDYQPIIDPHSGDIVGAEALMRWQDGAVRRAAGEFIDEAERSGQIGALGRRVIETLAADLPELRRSLPTGSIHVNLSVTELEDEALLDALTTGVLSGHSDQVVVEVTESMSLRPGSEAFAGLERLRQAGFRVAVDDFGTGYGSIRRLQSLRPEFVKADRSLLGGADAPVADWRAVLGAVQELSDALGSELIVEGVETQTQADEVVARGVRRVQGFLFARPMTLADLEAWCLEHRN